MVALEIITAVAARPDPGQDPDAPLLRLTPRENVLLRASWDDRDGFKPYAELLVTPRDGGRVVSVGASWEGFVIEQVLNERLDYRAPLLCAQMLGQCAGEPARALAWLEAAGVRFELGTVVDGTRAQRLAAEHDALFLGLGAQNPRAVALPGQDKAGVLDALGFLAAVNAGLAPDLHGGQVLVLGGGDTAMDCARSALRLGAAVTLAYRGAESRLRASPLNLKRRPHALGELTEFPLAVTGAFRFPLYHTSRYWLSRGVFLRHLDHFARAGMPLSYALHAVDALGLAEDSVDPRLGRHPGMRKPLDEKLALLETTFADIAARFACVPFRERLASL